MLIGIEVPDVSPNDNNIIDFTKRITLQRHDRQGGGKRENLQILLHCRFLLKGVSMLI